MLGLRELKRLLEKYPIVIVEAPFGSGKSQQLPLFLEKFEAEPKILSCLQPDKLLEYAEQIKQSSAEDFSLASYLMVDDIEANPWQLEILIAAWLNVAVLKSELRLLLCGTSWITDVLAERKDVGLHIVRPPAFPTKLIYASAAAQPISTLIPQLARNFCFFEDAIPSGPIAVCDSIVIRNLRDSATLFRILDKLGHLKPVDVYLTLTPTEFDNLPKQIIRDRTLAQKKLLVATALRMNIPLSALETDCSDLGRSYQHFQVLESRWFGKLNWEAIYLRSLEILLTKPISSTVILCLSLLQAPGLLLNLRGLTGLEALESINEQLTDLQSKTLNQFWWKLASKIDKQFPYVPNEKIKEDQVLQWTLLSSFFFQPIYSALRNRNIILETLGNNLNVVSEKVGLESLAYLAREILEWSPEALLNYSEEFRGYRNSNGSLFYFEEPLVSVNPTNLVLLSNNGMRVNRALEL